jgi:hypothetical protein
MTKQNRHAVAGRIGGLVTASRYDPHEYTSAARHAFLTRFERDVDPDAVLPDVERKRRARAALAAHMTRLARSSAKKRARATIPTQAVLFP